MAVTCGRSVSIQERSFEALLAQFAKVEEKQVMFADVPAETHSQTRQLRGVLL
jgi:hypothetical protein